MNTYSELSPFLQTVADRNRLLAELTKLKQSFFSTDNSDTQKVYDSAIRQPVAQVLLKMFENQDKQMLIEQIEKYLHELPVAKLVLAFDPTADQLAVIADYLQSQDQTPRLLEIEVDPEIIAGLQIAVDGKYGDYSLIKRVNEVWQQQGPQIVNQLIKH